MCSYYVTISRIFSKCLASDKLKPCKIDSSINSSQSDKLTFLTNILYLYLR